MDRQTKGMLTKVQSSAIARTCYETYVNTRMYNSQPVRIEM